MSMIWLVSYDELAAPFRPGRIVNEPLGSTLICPHRIAVPSLGFFTVSCTLGEELEGPNQRRPMAAIVEANERKANAKATLKYQVD